MERHIWAVSCLCCRRPDFGKLADETEIWAKVVTFLGANPTDPGNAAGIFHSFSCANPIRPVIAVDHFSTFSSWPRHARLSSETHGECRAT